MFNEFPASPSLRLFYGHTEIGNDLSQIADWPTVHPDQKIMLMLPGGALPARGYEITGLAREEDYFLKDINGNGLPDFFFKRGTAQERKKRADFFFSAARSVSSASASIIMMVPGDLNKSLEWVVEINRNPVECHIPELEDVFRSFFMQFDLLAHPERLQCFACSAGTALLHYAGLCGERLLREQGRNNEEILHWGKQIKALAICPVVLDWHWKIASATGREFNPDIPPLFETAMHFDPRDGHAAFFHHMRSNEFPDTNGLPEFLGDRDVLVQMRRRTCLASLVHIAHHDDAEPYHYHDLRKFLPDAVIPGQQRRVMNAGADHRGDSKYCL